MRERLSIAIPSLFLWVSIPWGCAQMLPSPALNPAKYASRSGKVVCEVDPSDLYGRGGANYRITVNGEMAWQGAKPFTLYEAGVTDSGTVVGCAYSHGLDGFSERGADRGPGTFRTVIMRSTGEIVLDEVVRRKESLVLHARPNPIADGLLVDEGNDLFVVRLSNPDVNGPDQILRGYRISTGKEMSVTTAALESPTAQSSFRVTPVNSRKAPELSSFPNQPLKLLGQFSFQDTNASSAPAVRDVICFDFDDQDRIGFVRREPSEKFTFVRIGPKGELLAEVNIAIPAEALTNDSPKAAWLKGDLWIVTASDRGVGGKAFGWWLDLGRREFKAIASFASPPIKSLHGTRDGGFVALVTTHLEYSMVDELIAFDGTGKIKWRIKQNYSGGRDALFSPEDVTVTTRGEIAIIDNIQKRVQLLGKDGGFLKAFDLEKIWRRKPNYPSEIAADSAGGFVIKDFDGKPPLVWMDANGKVLREFNPKHGDGRVIDAVCGVKASPTGRVWVCDGECLVRLTDNGTADLVLGSAPNASVLGKVAALTTDQTGRLYAVDERNGVVHVFDETGRRLHVCKPDTDDFTGKLVLPELSVNSDGEVFLSEGHGSPDEFQFIHFNSNGRRIGTNRFGLDEVKQELHALPDSGQLLIGYQDAYLFDRAAKVRRTIRRRPDQNWLEYPDSAAVAPDGSFAITTGRNYAKSPWQAHLYSAAGDPTRTLEMPAECKAFFFTYTGKHLVIANGSEVYFVTNLGEPYLRFSTDMNDLDGGLWKCFVTKGGRELWIASTQSKAVRRFELP